ncbi:MAG: M28 family metallopeptidase [Woeseiaceae bacterium]
MSCLKICGALLLVLALSTALEAQVADQDLLVQLQAEQTAFITMFSGADRSLDAGTVHARSTEAERRHSAEVLLQALVARGLDAAYHRYQYKNTNPAIDFLLRPMRGRNVVVNVPATTVDAKRYIVVGAHYDSVAESPGADDNASGVAAVMSIAAAINALEKRRFHFVFVWFDQEEDGGSGSKAFAEMMVADGRQIHSMHNIDMIGWDSDNDGAVDMEIPTEELLGHYEAAAEDLGIAISPTRFNSSDHLSFRDLGIDSVCLSEQFSAGDWTPHYHQSTDTVESVNFEYVAKSTLLMMRALTALSSDQKAL